MNVRAKHEVRHTTLRYVVRASQDGTEETLWQRAKHDIPLLVPDLTPSICPMEHKTLVPGQRLERRTRQLRVDECARKMSLVYQRDRCKRGTEGAMLECYSPVFAKWLERLLWEDDFEYPVNLRLWLIGMFPTRVEIALHYGDSEAMRS